MEKNIDINNIDLQQEERIMAYLRGEMSHEEEAEFMADLQKDSEFKEKAISMARLAKGISEVGEERDQILKEALQSTSEASVREIAKRATSKSNIITFKRPYAVLLSLAASLIFIVYFGFQYWDYHRTTSIGDQYAMQYDSSIMRGDVQPEIEKEVRDLVDNVYNGTNLDETLKRLAVLWEVSTLDTYNDYTDYAPEIGWALATGYLKDNNNADASVVLSKMSRLYDENTILGKKVRELQSKLI